MKAAKGFAETRMPESQLYEFGPFVLDTAQHLLLKGEKPVTLTPKTYDALLVLVRNSGRMLSKEELMGALWPDSFVEESNLTQQVSMIRKALGESPGEHRYIVTVPGRGYRFAAQVKSRPAERTGRAGESSQSELPGERVEGRAGSDKVLHMEPWSSSRGVPSAPAMEQKAAPSGVQSRSRLRVTVTVVALLTIVGIMSYVGMRKRPTAKLSPAGPRSLAILPFQNLRPDTNSDFLGFSLADAVITKLDYVSSLTVRPSSAVQKYRNQMIDIPKVTTDLNVDTLLTGNFLRDGDDLR